MINKALTVAKDCTDFTHRIGCVITNKRGNVVSTGYNKRKTHPLQAKHAMRINPRKCYLHAEIAALVRCREVPHTMYVARLTPGGNVGLAKPCPVCMMAIHEAGVKRVVYTTNDGSSETFDIN